MDISPNEWRRATSPHHWGKDDRFYMKIYNLPIWSTSSIDHKQRTIIHEGHIWKILRRPRNFASSHHRGSSPGKRKGGGYKSDPAPRLKKEVGQSQGVIGRWASSYALHVSDDTKDPNKEKHPLAWPLGLKPWYLLSLESHQCESKILTSKPTQKDKS